jgi:type 1 glutamine amidotransferase/nicotinamidase-related amidase
MNTRDLFTRRAIAIAALIAALVGLSTPAPAAPLKVCMVSGSEEYESDKTLPLFKSHLEERYQAACVVIAARGTDDLPGLEALDDCDVALFFTRRLTVPAAQLERVKRYFQSGKPIVAVRTASHGFQGWLELDHLILGGNYQGHCGPGLLTTRLAPSAKGHSILEGVPEFRSRASLYKTSPLAADAEVLLTGASTNCPETYPVAWTRTVNGGRVFYTSLGAQDDFENAAYRRLLANALFWAAGRTVERKEIPPPGRPAKAAGELALHLRSRVEAWKGSGRFEEVAIEARLPAAETAILICDLWDHHWCQGAEDRCEAIAEKMAPVVDAARARGVRVIHCPSETMDFYADRPQRLRMKLAPAVEPPPPLAISDPPLPIDDSDGGCDTPQKPWYMAWTRQSRHISIGEFDGISDNGAEVYSFLRQEGIKNLLVMGVHTNMCVLGRSFAIRQMTRWGLQCVLVRDLTDTMYDPQDAPRVSHDQGTALVVEHIEKYWCPTITSADLMKGLP